MTELLTTFAVLAPLATVFAAAAQTPKYADGTPVRRMRRNFLKDLRCLMGGTY